MATVSETIPDALQPETQAALTWFNATQSDHFEVTGIVDAEQSIASGEPRTLRLVLCGGAVCIQQGFTVSKAASGFEVACSQPETTDRPGEQELQDDLDPPPGALRLWIDSLLPRHRFVLLVFYRGFW